MWRECDGVNLRAASLQDRELFAARDGPDADGAIVADARRLAHAEFLEGLEVTLIVLVDLRLEACFARMRGANGVHDLLADHASILLDVSTHLVGLEQQPACVARHARDAGFDALIRSPRVGDY